MILAALHGVQNDGWQGLQIDLASLGDRGISRVAASLRALAIVVTHDAGVVYVQRAEGLDLR